MRSSFPPQARSVYRRPRIFHVRSVDLECLEGRLLLTQGPTQVSTYVASSPQLISNVDVNYSQYIDGASVRITSGLVTSEDRLLFTNQNNISGAYDSATGVLTLSGKATGTTYATALKSVQYSNLAANPSNADRSFSVQLGTATYYSGTGHYYAYISGANVTWSNARADASSRSSLGLTGYLATITSAAEQTFVYDTFGGTRAWLGASDYTSKNTWRWLTGPEGTQSGGAGLPFYSGSPVNGAYNNWYPGYPLATNTNINDYVMMYSNGQWITTGNNVASDGYILEYGGLGATPNFNDRWSGTIHVLDRTDSPIVTSPAVATLVNATANAITGTAPANSLVQVFVDADNNGVADTPGTAVASQQLAGGATAFSISTPLTQDVANNFVVLATAYAGASPSLAIDVPTITDNAPPTIASKNAAVSTPEGSPATNTGTFSDLQGNATVTLTASLGTVTQSNAAGTWSWSRNSTDGPSGPITIVITATDSFSVATQSTFTYTVKNVAPTISLSGATTVNEGSPYTLILGAATDPGTDTITSYSINWGDGVTENFTGSPSGSSKTHTYPDGPFNRTYGVSVTDEDGSFLAGGMSVQVLNVAPTASFASNGPLTYGQTATLSFSNQHDDSVTDTSADFHYAFSTTAGTSGGFSDAAYASSSATSHLDVSGLTVGDHVYYARIIDKDNGFSEYSLTVTVIPPLVSVIPGGSVISSKKTGITGFVIKVSGKLDAASAQRLGNYQLFQIVKKGKKITHQAIALKSATYDAAAGTITLAPLKKKYTLSGSATLQITGDGIRDNFGRAFDANHDGQAGGIGTVVVTSRTVTAASVATALHARAVDRVLHGLS